MSLDENLFTLIITPSKEDPINVVDLVDSKTGAIYYRKQRIPGAVYTAQVYGSSTINIDTAVNSELAISDFLSESLLLSATAPSSTSKVKVLELFNPSSLVELKYTGTLSFRWSFKWEE